MAATHYWHRLPEELREKILDQLRRRRGELPISTARIMETLRSQAVPIDLSDEELKNSIAEAAIQNGFNVVFEP